MKGLETWLIRYIKLGKGRGSYPKGPGLNEGMRMASSIAFVDGRGWLCA